MSSVPHLDDILADAINAAAAAAREPVEIQPNFPEPPHGSVVMVTSPTGTAAQRFYEDGLWHLTTGLVKTYEGLFTRSDGRRCDVFLLWTAPVEDEGR